MCPNAYSGHVLKQNENPQSINIANIIIIYGSTFYAKKVLVRLG